MFEQNLLYLAGPWINDDIVRYVEDVYPQFASLIHVIKRGGAGNYRGTNNSWGEVPSIFRSFVSNTLRLVADDPGYCRAISELPRTSWLGPRLPEFLSFQFCPSILPTETFINDMCHLMRLDLDNSSYSEGEAYRTSATINAVSYLTSLSPGILSQIRKIVLHEDRTSACWPESHAQYLVPTCKANPHLHIEQRVGLWMNVWPASDVPIKTLLGSSYKRLSTLEMDALHSDSVTRPCLAPWIMETLALPSFGMPPNAFSLVLDGEVVDERTSRGLEDEELTSRVFGVVQRDAVWQNAFEECFYKSRNVIPGSSIWQNMMGNYSYIMRGFPDAIRDITDKKSSLISCNFNPGSSWKIVEHELKGCGWWLEEWNKQWTDQRTEIFRTAPFLPDWLSIRQHDCVPEETDPEIWW